MKLSARAIKCLGTSKHSGINYNGLYIAFEGINGSGKSTQIKLLAEELEKRGYKIILTEETYDKTIRTVIRSMTTDKVRTYNPQAVAYLHAADRILHMEEVVVPNLLAGNIVISDRSVFALAYQAVNSELTTEQLININAFAVVPDVSLFLVLPVNTAERRTTKRGELARTYENSKFQSALQDKYLWLKNNLNYNIKIVNAENDVQSVHQEIIRAVEEVLK